MHTDSKNNQSHNDSALSKLYKSGVNESPSSQLDEKILNYAAKQNIHTSHSSHFDGGWKVPLSLAASVLLVFTILLQLDNNPEQLPKELPPLPTTNKTDADIFFEAEESLDVPATIENKAIAREKLRQQNRPEEILTRPDAALEKSMPTDTDQINTQETRESFQDSDKDSQRKAKRSTADDSENDGVVDNIELNSTLQGKSNQVLESATQEAGATLKNGAASSVLPAEDWLLSIEKLITEKNYTAAKQQLNNFKQAHPNTNVEHLESKLP